MGALPEAEPDAVKDAFAPEEPVDADEPGEPGYPPDQVELLSEVHLRSALDLQDGDRLAFSLV